MELTRNHYFMIGLIIVFLGIELRMVESFVLNEKVTKAIAEKIDRPSQKVASFFPSVGPLPRKVIRPPQWLGWALISVGSVLVLHSLAMQKPGGG